MPIGGYAQKSSVETGVVVRSTPAGAQVTLTGEAVVSGVSPVHFHQPLIGGYELKIEKYGWEDYRTRVVLDPTKLSTFDVSLSPKTRFKAAARSLLIPGWGQMYTEQKSKGLLMLGLVAASGAAYLIADDDFDYKYDSYVRRREAYDSVAVHGTREDLAAAYEELVRAQDRAYDAENIRRATIVAGAVVWAVNVLDVLFFFPEERGTFSIKGVAVEPTATIRQVGLTLSTSF